MLDGPRSDEAPRGGVSARDARREPEGGARRGAPHAASEGRWLTVLLGLFLAGGLGGAAYQAACAPEVAFFTERPPAHWIRAPLEPSTLSRGPRYTPLVHEFRRAFELERMPASAHLRVRAFQAFELRVNGRAAAASGEGENWKRSRRVEVAELLRPGRNRVRVRVEASHGPPALWLAGEGLPRELHSGPDWRVAEPEGTARPAQVADDTLPPAASFRGPRPLASLQAKGSLLVGILALATLLFRLRPSLPERGAVGVLGGVLRRPETVLLAAFLGWGALFANNAGAVPLPLGFDARPHLAYVHHLLEETSLPAADEARPVQVEGRTVRSWESHQPPLFYALGALLVAAARSLGGGAGADAWLKLLPFVAALGQIALVAVAARGLLPRSPGAQGAALALAALAPLHLYMAHYVSNEPLSAALIAATLVLALGLLRRPLAGLGGWVALGAVAGLSLATKATAAASLPLVFAALAYALLVRERAGPAAAGARLGVALLLAGGIGGAFYLRNALLYGTPLVMPWEGGMGPDWWQDPGFHTAAFFLQFGRVFSLPNFAGFYSFLDGLYATFWGDALLGGAPGLPGTATPPWDYGWMGTLYPLGLPLTLLVALGAAGALHRVLRGASLGWWLILAAVVANGLSLLFMNLRIPYYGQVKSSYALGALLPLALLAGRGFEMVDGWLARRRAPLLRALLRAWFALLASAVAITFWARGGSAGP